MLPSGYPILKRFWYCIAPSAAISGKPFPFTLLGEAVVLWRDKEGLVRAVKDRCLHRTAKLSLGTVENGNIVCPYHGWTFSGTGQCVRVPQDVIEKPNPFGVPAYHCAERYNHVWVALEDPIHDIPLIAEFSDPGYRQVIEFREVWSVNPQRIVENSFDPAHIAFVHKNSFGTSDPSIDPFTLTETEDGFIFENDIRVLNPEHMKDALAIEEDETRRHSYNRFYLPFSRVGRIVYPTGLENILCTFLTPIDDTRTQFIQWVMRNDTEAEVSSEKVIAFDRLITNEDKDILESTDFNVPLDNSEGVELHMVADRPGMLMRKMLRHLAQAG